MLIINFIILILFISSTVYCSINAKEWMRSIDKKEHKLYFLYPLIEFFISKSHLEKVLRKKVYITDSIKAIYSTNKPEVPQKLYWCNRISIIIAILFLFNLLSLFGQLETVSNSVLMEGKYLMRPDYGEGSQEVELNVTVENSKGSNATNSEMPSLSKDLTIHVKEREYTPQELQVIFEEAFHFLEVDVLGNNESSELIYEDLHFCEAIPGTSISVEWKPEDYNLVQLDGTVENKEVNEKGIITTVTAVLTYLEQQKEYCMSFRIMPRQYSKEEMLQKKLVEELIEASDKTAEEKRLELPGYIENYRLSWKDKETDTGVILFVLGIITAASIWFMGDKELEKQMKLRKDQMLLDYPEIINKFTLLVNAGMTVKQAWIKIAEDYSDKLTHKHIKKRYAYEEMITTVHELKLGLAENIAYEQYARRIGIIAYIKFGSLISQNLKKGNKGFTELLRKEAMDAFEERKEIAKRLGEEAGTKLLIPMMLMLIIVFMIILIPAFWSFQM